MFQIVLNLFTLQFFDFKFSMKNKNRFADFEWICSILGKMLLDRCHAIYVTLRCVIYRNDAAQLQNIKNN